MHPEIWPLIVWAGSADDRVQLAAAGPAPRAPAARTSAVTTTPRAIAHPR
jgi:hypothetical protein